MKKYILFLLSIAYGVTLLQAQSVGIGTTIPDSTAILDLTSTDKGFLIPRITESQKNNIVNPAEGLMIYQTSNDAGFYYHTLGTWQQIGKGGNQWTKNGSELFTLTEQVGIGTNDVHSSAAFEIANDIKGILIPRVSQIDREDIISPAEGLLVYQFNNEEGFYYFDGSMWNIIGKGGNEWIKNGSDLYNTVHNIGIGVTFPYAKFHINNGTEASLSDFSGQQVIGLPSTKNLIFDTDEIQARNNRSASTLKLQEQGGNLDIGNSTDIEVKILSTRDMNLSQSGGLSVGNTFKVTIDEDEIQARNGLAANTLTLQRNGGSLRVGSTVSSSILLTENRLKALDNNNPTPLILQQDGSDVEIGNSASNVRILSTQAASLSNIGGLTIGNSTSPQLLFDYDGIQAKYISNASPLFLQSHGGDVWIGDNVIVNGAFTNKIPLSILGGSSTSLSNNSGYLTIGDSTNTHISIDNNRMQARDDGNNSDLEVQPLGGNLVIGNAGTSVRMRGTGIASLTGNGIATMGSFAGNNLVFGSDEIQARFGSNNATLYIQEDGGAVSIGDNLEINGSFSNNVPLSVNGGTNTGLSNTSGYIIVGDTTTNHISIDNNEIQARNSGVVSSLLIQQDGGLTDIGGNIELNGVGDGVPLNILGGEDAGLSVTSEGYLALGITSGQHILMDQNEIISKSNATTAAPLYIQASGSGVTIGSGNLPTHELDVDGTAGKTGGGSWSTFSDIRLKKDIVPYQDGLSTLIKIDAIKYKYNELAGYKYDKEYIGVIAQDLQKIAPYMVSESKKIAPDGSAYLELDNSAMTYMLINAVKELAKQNEELKMKNEELKIERENDYNTLKAELEYIKQIISPQNIVIKK